MDEIREDVPALLDFVRYGNTGSARLVTFVENDGTEHYVVVAVTMSTYDKAGALRSLEAYKRTYDSIIELLPRSTRQMMLDKFRRVVDDMHSDPDAEALE